MRKKLVAFITLLALLTAAVPAYAFSYVIRVSGGNAAVFGGAAYILTFNAVRSENGDVTVNIKDKEGNLLGSAGAAAGEGPAAHGQNIQIPSLKPNLYPFHSLVKPCLSCRSLPMTFSGLSLY